MEKIQIRDKHPGFATLTEGIPTTNENGFGGTVMESRTTGIREYSDSHQAAIFTRSQHSRNPQGVHVIKNSLAGLASRPLIFIKYRST
jgi:hypothetical protein